MNRSNKDIFLYVIAFLICSVPLFYHLGSWHIRIWDEARYANNAIDMLMNKTPWVISYEGKPDLYNTKPPFVILCEAVSMGMLGINSWALRLPVALFGLMTVILIFLFCLDVLKSKSAAFLSALTLISLPGYIDKHVMRTGDLDGILVFWEIFYFLIFIRYLAKREKFNLHIIFISIGICFAFLTKGVAGLFFLPFMAIITFLNKNYKDILFKRALYLSTIFTICFMSGYLFLRESLAPGYLNVVYGSEISRFTVNVMPWHEHSFVWYFEILDQKLGGYFIYYLPFTFLSFFIGKDQKIKWVLGYILMVFLGFILILSFPSVKLYWYIAPCYPLVALMIGFFLSQLWEILRKEINVGKITQAIIPIALVAFIFYKPYFQIINSIRYKGQDIEELEIEGAFMRHLKKNSPEVKKYTIIKNVRFKDVFYDQINFYKRAYEIENQYQITIKPNIGSLNSRDSLLLICNQNVIDSLNKTERILNTLAWNNCVICDRYAVKTK